MLIFRFFYIDSFFGLITLLFFVVLDNSVLNELCWNIPLRVTVLLNIRTSVAPSILLKEHMTINKCAEHAGFLF